MIRFQCLEGCASGRSFEFESDSVLLGRDRDCAVCLEDEACSRHHARIDATSSGYRITDLDSTNGLWVNGQRLKEAVLVQGDRITLGRNLFLFLSGGPGEEPNGSALRQDSYVENTISIDHIEERVETEYTDVEELRRLHRRMGIALRFCRTINATLSSEDLYSVIARSIFENFEDVECVSLLLRRAEGSELELVRKVAKSPGKEFPVSRSVLQRAERERVGILAMDASTDDRFVSSHSVAIMDLRSLMCAPLVTRNRFLGAIYVENRSKPGCFKKQDLELLTLIGNQVAFAVENAFLYEDLEVSFYETVCSLSNALEAKDRYTRGHSSRVASLAVAIGEALGLDAERLERLRTAADLHDIGKIAIREEIIGKSGKLTDEEFEAIKKHPQLGVDILKPIRFLKPILPFILHHHERYNGKGYPAGLQGEEIPLEARIINLADAFDAMTTQRPYNRPKSARQALEQCSREAGVSFDGPCVQALHAVLERRGALASREAGNREPQSASH
jgi:putative nucleotidyltransferase with HDIG domain